jgi:acyl carrier protein phosphodiesterase
MKFRRLNFQNLNNEKWFQYFTEFKNLVERLTPEAIDIKEMFIVFLSLYSDADTALVIIRKSAETALLDGADQKRDLTFRGLVDVVKSAHNHFDPMKQNAAFELDIVFDHFGNLSIKTPNDETASIYNFLQEIRKYSAQISLLGLEDWLVELENNNKAYDELVTKRNISVTSRTSLRMVDVRKQTQDVYRKIIERVEALILVNGEEKYADFVTQLNGFIKQYNDVIAQRKGAGKNDASVK